MEEITRKTKEWKIRDKGFKGENKDSNVWEREEKKTVKMGEVSGRQESGNIRE